MADAVPDDSLGPDVAVDGDIESSPFAAMCSMLRTISFSAVKMSGEKTNHDQECLSQLDENTNNILVSWPTLPVPYNLGIRYGPGTRGLAA